MKLVRVLGVEVNVNEVTPKDIENLLNKEFIGLEKNGSRVINTMPCGDKGFLILHEEPFHVMP